MKTLFTFLFAASLALGQGSGSALSFDGNDYIQASTNNFGVANEGSISAWVKTPTTPAYRWIAGKYTSSEDRGFFIHMSSLNGGIGVSGRNGNGSYYFTGSPNSYTDGQWHHVVGIHNNGLWQIYVDGVLVSSQTTPTGNVNNNQSFEVGRFHRSGGQAFWDGDIDEVSLWNRALTQAEIRQMMCQGLDGNENGLVTYYRMNEGTDGTCGGGEDVCDASGNGNHGTKF